MKYKIVIATMTLWLQAATVGLALPSAQEEISAPALLEKPTDTDAKGRDAALALQIQEWAKNLAADQEENTTCPEVTGQERLEEYLDLIMLDYGKRDACSKGIATYYFSKHKNDHKNYNFYGADTNNPELTMLLLNSGTMTEQEKQYWLDILPQMTEEQVQRLDDILQVGYYKGKMP